ncbi:MAG: RelA/SpoT family protein [Nanoarchaeota archaeon]
MNIQKIIKRVEKYDKKADLALIKRAYEFAKEVHKGQKRISNESYIQHPLNVAMILANLKLDDKTIAVALLHDVIEMSNLTIDRIRKEFGGEIALIVDGVTNTEKITSNYRAENIKKFLVATIKDIRVIFVKLADRLHNMRTLKYLSKSNQEKIAKEVLEVYVPLAYRLGMWSIKNELEDLALKYLDPKEFNKLKRRINEIAKDGKKIIKLSKNMLKRELRKNKIKAVIYSRIKHPYSIYNKTIRKNNRLEEIYDILGLRVITNSIENCYIILGLIHNLWKAIPGTLRDYISTPKSNMYQSLHTTVIGPANKPVEFQVRTKEMHETAEEGVAAHWAYKGVTSTEDFDKKLSWIKQILEWKRDSKDDIKLELFEDEIFIFTPKKDVIELPSGSSVIDFAYAVHTSVGDKAVGAEINNRFMPLKTELKNGDIVRIITSKNKTPSREWLKFVKTQKAKEKIKKAIKLKQNIPIKSISKIEEKRQEYKNLISSSISIKNLEIKISGCCKPLPNDKIIGIKRGNKLMVHKQNCEFIKDNSNRISISWVQNVPSLVELSIEAIERPGIIKEILNIITSEKMNVKTTKAKPIGKELIKCTLILELSSLEKITKLIEKLKKINKARDVYIAEAKAL